MKWVQLCGGALGLAFGAGCLSSAPAPATLWLIEPAERVRAQSVAVDAPYDSANLTVLRADGSVAFDPYNSFAARPSVLLRNALVRGGKGTLRVRRLALDCRQSGMRQASVALEWSEGTDGVPCGEASCAVVDGGYGVAFSRAFSEALSRIQSSVRKP